MHRGYNVQSLIGKLDILNRDFEPMRSQQTGRVSRAAGHRAQHSDVTWGVDPCLPSDSAPTQDDSQKQGPVRKAVLFRNIYIHT